VRLRRFVVSDEAPRLADEGRWYTEHTAILISTTKWAFLGAVAGVCVGLGTRVFLWSLDRSAILARTVAHGLPPYLFLPIALPLCVWIIHTFARDARGHGTEAVIAAVHQRSGRVDWLVAPVKLAATVLTLAFGGSVGKEGPAAQIGAALTSLFADIFRLRDEDRRRLVICGISAGFAAVFGTPVSGALFGIEVLYLGFIDYSVIFPALVAGIVAHLVCGVRPPFPALQPLAPDARQVRTILIMLACGALFGGVALLLIESLRFFERALRRFERHRYLLAAAGGAALVVVYQVFGDAYAGLGVDTVDGALAGTIPIVLGAFAVKILATSITLETGGSGGIVTPIFFVGATSGVTLARVFGMPPTVMAAVGLAAMLGAAANTPIAAAVMAMEVLPAPEGVYAALATATAFLIVGHRSVYASQKLGLSKSAGLDLELGGVVGDVNRSSLRIRKGSLTERVHRLARSPRAADEPSAEPASPSADESPAGRSSRGDDCT
jgi:H+/Cl- antiporter ClcA